MTVHELQQEILRLKREKNICILAHAYQSQPVLGSRRLHRRFLRVERAGGQNQR